MVGHVEGRCSMANVWNMAARGIAYGGHCNITHIAVVTTRQWYVEVNSTMPVMTAE